MEGADVAGAQIDLELYGRLVDGLAGVPAAWPRRQARDVTQSIADISAGEECAKAKPPHGGQS